MFLLLFPYFLDLLPECLFGRNQPAARQQGRLAEWGQSVEQGRVEKGLKVGDMQNIAGSF